ncbi:MAG: hypothetical protein FWD76_04700 [Firmicutes bacterium]|nr:hypothetical protein [Bacillota bacterium]
MEIYLNIFWLAILGLFVVVFLTLCIVARMNGKYKKDFAEHRRKVLFAKKGWIVVFVVVLAGILVAATVATFQGDFGASLEKLRWMGGIGLGLAWIVVGLYVSKELKAVVTYKKRKESSEQQ